MIRFACEKVTVAVGGCEGARGQVAWIKAPALGRRGIGALERY